MPPHPLPFQECVLVCDWVGGGGVGGGQDLLLLKEDDSTVLPLKLIERRRLMQRIDVLKVLLAPSPPENCILCNLLISESYPPKNC
jgi:hypothetical protein